MPVVALDVSQEVQDVAAADTPVPADVAEAAHHLAFVRTSPVQMTQLILHA